MANPLLGSLIDPFTTGTLNTTLWNQTSGTGVSLTAPGRVGVQASSSYYTLGAGTYDATGQAIYARITPALAGTGGAGVQTLLKVQKDSNNSAYFLCQPGVQFQAIVYNAGTATTTNLPAYDPTGHAWWRLRETSGSFAFETSADGAAWTTLATIAYSWSPTAVATYFTAGVTDSTTGETAYIEHVNTTAGASSLMPSWPLVQFQVAFNTGGTSATAPNWTDLTSRLRGSWSAQLAGRQYELDQIQSGQLTVTLWNLDGALDPTNTASPYAPNVLPMRPCRLQATWPPTRNLVPQGIANGTAPASAWFPYRGSIAPVTGLAAAPTGHTTATAWTFPATSGNANEWPLVTGNTGSGAEPTSFPVIVGQAYAASIWMSRSTGGDTTISLSPTILWYGQDGSQIGSTGTNVTVPVTPTWAQATVTGTAPAGAVWARLAWWFDSATTTAQNVIYFTALQFEEASAPTPWTAPGVVYPLWQGYVERWPQQWDYSGTYGTVDLTCTDLLAGLAQFTLSPNVEAQLLSLGPTQFYPLDEPQGSTSFRDLTGKRQPLTIGNSPYGAGSITAGSSITGSGFVGGSGPVVTINNPTPPSNGISAGSFLQVSGTKGPPSSGGWCRIICFRTTTVPSGSNQMMLWFAGNTNNSQGAAAALLIDSNQHLIAWAQNSSAQGITVPVPTVSVCDGNWHMAAMLLTPAGTQVDVNVDGIGYYNTTSVDMHGTYIDDSIGMQVDRNVNGYYCAFSGDIAYACEFPTNNLPSLDDIASGFATGWAGETSAARAQRILNLAGLSTTLATNDATTAMGGASFTGSDAMSALEVVANSEAGNVYVDGAGVLHLNGRLWRYLQNAPSVTFGEQQGNGEIPYLGDAAVDFDTTHIYNDVQVTNQVAPNSTAQPAAQSQNTSSQQNYFPRTLQRDINVQDQTAQQYQASYIASQYGQPLPRVAALTIDAAANPALWSTILGLGFGTRAQVNRRPPSGPGAPEVTLQQFVEHLTWDGDDQGNFKLALQLTPAQPYLGWWVVASLHSTLQSQATAGTNAVTLGALTGSALNPASAVLAAGTQLVVGYGTSAAETVTVQSVAATSPGYTSVVVTLTANLANTHASGAVVCQPLPSGYQAPPAVLSGFPGSLDSAATLSSTTPRVAY